MTESEPPWRALHPASVFVNLLPVTWRTLRNTWPLLVLIVVQGSIQGAVNLLLILMLFGMAALRTVLHFLTLRYRVADGQLQISTGLLSRNFRAIDPARIQNVEIVQNLFHKLAGLVELRVETAGGRDVEGLLSAITVAEAESLRAQLAHQRAEPVEEAHEALKLGFVEVVAYGFTAGRIGAAAVIIGLAFDSIAQLTPAELRAATEQVRGATIGGIVLVSLAGAYLLSAGNAVLRYSGFKMWETATGLATEAGLFTRRRVEVPRKKVQAARIDEPVLRRLMGFSSLHLDTAGSGVPVEAGGLPGEVLVPMVDAHNRLYVLESAMPELDFDPWAAELRPAARRQLGRALLRATVFWGLAGVALYYGLGTAWAFAGLPYGLASAWLDWRAQGWAVTPTHVLARRGFWRRTTWIVARKKIQSVHRFDGPILRWNRLAQVAVWVAGDQVTLPVLDAPEAERVFRELGPRTPAQ